MEISGTRYIRKTAVFHTENMRRHTALFAHIAAMRSAIAIKRGAAKPNNGAQIFDIFGEEHTQRITFGNPALLALFPIHHRIGMNSTSFMRDDISRMLRGIW